MKTAPVRVAHWGTQITTPEVSEQSATVNIQVRLDNATEADAVVVVKHEIFELDTTGNRGKSVAFCVTPDLKIPAQQSASGGNQMILQSPRLWSIEHPQRYLAVTTVEQNGKAMDRYETPFGIRTIAFPAVSCGVSRYPVHQAMRVSVHATLAFLAALALSLVAMLVSLRRHTDPLLRFAAGAVFGLLLAVTTAVATWVLVAKPPFG